MLRYFELPLNKLFKKVFKDRSKRLSRNNRINNNIDQFAEF